jgi:diguanylate cyclase (GGDEF)-like protein
MKVDETHDSLKAESDDKPRASGLRRFFNTVTSRFLRLTIAKKMLLGYLSLLVLLIIISIFALVNLNRLNTINHSILQTDIPVIATADKLIDIILSQELYARRYAILKTADMLNLFWERNEEFNRHLNNLKAIPEDRDLPLEELARLHASYSRFIVDGIGVLNAPASSEAAAFDRRVKAGQEEIIKLIRGLADQALLDQNQKTGITATIGSIAYKAAVFLCLGGLVLTVVTAMLITRNISGAINELNYATSMIAKGNFDHKLEIRNKDELGDLAKAFAIMAQRLKLLEAASLDTSPLTRLPGGVAIDNIMKTRISEGNPVAFCLMDLDNFKAYNDHYGYAKGNDLIQKTASIIKTAVASYGMAEDFVGHIGGDDFVLITTPERYQKICEDVTAKFDQVVPDFYNDADRERGYIVGENRQGQKVSFPLASISIAVVTNQNRSIDSYIRFGEIAAEVKELAKSMTGSVFVVDRRS